MKSFGQLCYLHKRLYIRPKYRGTITPCTTLKYYVMERWVGRVALVTGASAGMGVAITRALVSHGMNVIGCARNIQKIQELAEKLSEEKGHLTAIACDLSKEDEIISLFAKVKSSHGGVDVCINNAGLSHDASLLSGNTDQWRNMLEVNVLGLCICTREAVKSMTERNIDDGHVIHINSVVGHTQYSPRNPSTHFYSATKFAVTALTEGLKNELMDSHIRVTSISPGLTETEFTYRMYPHDKEKAKKKHSQIENLKPEDIADAVVYALSVPKHVRVSELTILPTETPWR